MRYGAGWPGRDSRAAGQIPRDPCCQLRSGRPPAPQLGRRLAAGRTRRLRVDFEHILVARSGDFATITMNRPQRRNALSAAHMRELITAFTEVGGGDAVGIVLAGNGPVFSAGHDFADVAGADLA